MRASMLFLTIIFCISILSGVVLAQGTRDPSNPVPRMVFPIRPRDEATTTRPIIVPNNAPQPPVQLRRIYSDRIPR